VVPDGSPELIFNLADRFRAQSGGGSMVEQPLAMLVGQITGPLVLAPTGTVDIVGVRFQPFGASFLLRELAPVTDRWVPADALPRARLASIRQALGEARSPETRADLLDRRLGEMARTANQPDRRVVTAVRRIRERPTAVSIGGLLTELGLTARSLERRFAAQVGISPKFLARICRFQRVLAARRDSPGNWTRVALQCGYFDQSHLIRDFRQFGGATPAEFIADEGPFSRFFSPSRQAGLDR
jgi:AraC-like DNA-binding protein